LKAAAVAAVLPGAGSPEPEWVSWRVDGTQVNGWLQQLAKFGANPEGGVSRVGFGDADVFAHGWIRPLMENAGLAVQAGPAGNLIGRRAGTDSSKKPLLFGSHIDSVLHGGNYDGDVGTLGAIGVAVTLHAKGYRNRHPLWVTLWCDEESGLTGSRGFLGQIDADELARPDVRDGVTLGDKIRKLGGDPTEMATYRHEPGSIAGY